MADTPEEVASDLVRRVMNATNNADAERPIASALREAEKRGEARGFAKGLEAARLAVDDEEEGAHGMNYQLGDVEDFRKRCIARIRALAPKAPPDSAAAEPKP